MTAIMVILVIFSGFQNLHTNKYETLINNDFNFKSYDFISSMDCHRL